MHLGCVYRPGVCVGCLVALLLFLRHAWFVARNHNLHRNLHLHFLSLCVRPSVPTQLVVVNPGWEEPPPGTTPTPAATAPTASAPPTPAPSHTQQQQPALAPPPPRLLSRSAPTSAVGGSETDAGSSEAVDGGDSESSDDDEGEEDVVARCVAVLCKGSSSCVTDTSCRAVAVPLLSNSHCFVLLLLRPDPPS